MQKVQREREDKEFMHGQDTGKILRQKERQQDNKTDILMTARMEKRVKGKKKDNMGKINEE